jgi:hypothetical protein
MIQLFDFIRILFEDPVQYKELSSYDKQRNFFMTNRLMSIQYPVQANALNNIKISQAPALDYWHNNMSNVYTQVPNWVFAKGQKKAESDKKQKSTKLPSKPAIKEYTKSMKITNRELEDAFILFGDAVYDPIRKLEKVMNQ